MAEAYRALTDLKLIELTRGGDAEAFAQLTDRYLNLIRGKAGLFTGPSAPERDDLLQEGFLGFYAAAARYDPSRGASFGTFAGVCIQNRMADAVRRFSKESSDRSLPLEKNELSEEGPEQLIELRDHFSDFLRRAGQTLTPLEKKALAFYFDGVKRSEIERTGMELRAYDNAVYRARAKLRSLLRETGL